MDGAGLLACWAGGAEGIRPLRFVEWRSPKQNGLQVVGWIDVGGVEWLFWEWNAPKQALRILGHLPCVYI